MPINEKVMSVSISNINTGKELLDLTKREFTESKFPHKSFNNNLCLDMDIVSKKELSELLNNNQNKYYIEFNDTKKYQCRKHKKKRINKKWMKQYGFYNLKYKSDIIISKSNEIRLVNVEKIGKIKCD